MGMNKKTTIGGILLGLIVGACMIWAVVTPLAAPSSDALSSSQAVEDEPVRGIWVATADRLDFPSAPDLSQAQLKAEIDAILQDAKAWGMNTVVFQVRPSCDALYVSKLFPVSSVISTSGNLPDGFDVLAYAVEAAHAQDMKLHAWINPLRVTTGATDTLPENSPAYQHPEWVIPYADGRLYLDAGQPEVRQLVLDGVMEIVNNYDVDGIHFDDYFYPYPVEGGVFDDTASYQAYGAGRTLEDWRRDNITELITQVHAAITDTGKAIEFGVSPFGVWQNAASDPLGSNTTAGIETYSDLYADTRRWVKEGLIDYICPQIYWSFEQEPAPFATVFDWWTQCVADTDVTLLVGHAFYKQGTDQAGWDDVRQTARQVEYAGQNAAYGGSFFFRYAHLKANPNGATQALSEMLQTAS